MEKELISVIVPCYNEQEVLPLFKEEILRVAGEMTEKYPQIEFEFLFIDDGSRDATRPAATSARKRGYTRVSSIPRATTSLS